MNSTRLAESIRDQALALGYEKCAMIPLPKLAGYGSVEDDHLRRIPDDPRKDLDKAVLANFSAFRTLSETYPWAKSAVVTVMGYGVYQIPQNLKGKVARYFCVDSRRDPNSFEYQASAALESFLAANGLRVETERKFGLLPLRWAANKAGLGRGRRNNFFYTNKGSWAHLEAWLIDQDLELTETTDLKPCPSACHLCQKACPTGALAEAFLTRPGSCLTFINALRRVNWIEHPYSQAAGDWIYGCDLCQTSCPFNEGLWREEREYPGLEELSRDMDLGRILELDYDFIKEKLVPKFWYLTADRAWQWKLNVLNAMKNNWDSGYAPYLRQASRDDVPEVRVMAQWVLRQVYPV
ncbi:MAG: epoxyqueuosine reductase [Deltaproteobacteria bacterium]|jgi:epoxyqueuosine reductase|nr:epoxyqueuosine reductase [Deltaproteobacteria bacterium]